MKRVTRNKILIWVILLGLANFAIYTFFYWYFQGDARNGFICDGEYYLRGHFLRIREGIASAPVSRSVWIYSYIHSISIWPTIGSMLVSMFILARPHIMATIKSDSMVTGKGFVNVCISLVVLVTLVSTSVFVVNLCQALNASAAGNNFGM